MPELIDKQALLEVMCFSCPKDRGGICRNEQGRCAEYTIINLMPTIETKPVRRGRWIPTEYDGYSDGNPVYDTFECSECGHEHKGEDDTLTAFCPDCGAQMNGKECEENDNRR